MDVNQKMLEKAEEFLKDKFNSRYMADHPSDREYRLQHSYRVANIGKCIAEKEGFDVTEMTIACLFHDISYCDGIKSDEEWSDHGRRSAGMVRSFLESIGLAPERVQDICYGIAIHVDDEADFEGEHTAFTKTVGDADNIDRFDAYRIYEGLQYIKFSEMTFQEKKNKVDATLKKLRAYHAVELGTPTATEMWKKRLEFNITFFEKLEAQLSNSISII